MGEKRQHQKGQAWPTRMENATAHDYRTWPVIWKVAKAVQSWQVLFSISSSITWHHSNVITSPLRCLFQPGDAQMFRRALHHPDPFPALGNLSGSEGAHWNRACLWFQSFPFLQRLKTLEGRTDPLREDIDFSLEGVMGGYYNWKVTRQSKCQDNRQLSAMQTSLVKKIHWEKNPFAG